MGPMSPLQSAFLECGPPQKSSCEYVEQAAADIRLWVVLKIEELA